MINCVLPGDYRRLMHSWVDYITMQNNNNKNLNAVSAELTGIINKLTNQKQNQPQSMEKQPTLLKGYDLHCQTKGIWKSKWDWNSKMLRETSYANKALCRLHQETVDSTVLRHEPDWFKAKGIIYAMVHLPSNMIFVIASSNRLDLSVKQQWYGSYLRNTKFHKTIQRNKLRNIMIWPLEKLPPEGSAKLRKQYWIHKLNQKSKNKKQRKWVPKHDRARVPNLQQECKIQEPDQITEGNSETEDQLASLRLDTSDTQPVELELVLPTSEIHDKKDGTLDMRHTSSKLYVASQEQEVHLQNFEDIIKVNTGNGEQPLVVDTSGSSFFELGDVPQTPPHIIDMENYLCISPTKDGKAVSEAVSGNQALGETCTTATNISDIIKCIVDAPKEPRVCVPQDADNWYYCERCNTNFVMTPGFRMEYLHTDWKCPQCQISLAMYTYKVRFEPDGYKCKKCDIKVPFVCLKDIEWTWECPSCFTSAVNCLKPVAGYEPIPHETAIQIYGIKSASELWNTMRHIRDQDSDLYWTLHGLWQDKNEEERYNKLSPEKKAQEDQEKMERMRRSNRNTTFPVNERQVTSKNQTKKRNKGNKNKF